MNKIKIGEQVQIIKNDMNPFCVGSVHTVYDVVIGGVLVTNGDEETEMLFPSEWCLFDSDSSYDKGYRDGLDKAAELIANLADQRTHDSKR